MFNVADVMASNVDVIVTIIGKSSALKVRCTWEGVADQARGWVAGNLKRGRVKFVLKFLLKIWLCKKNRIISTILDGR